MQCTSARLPSVACVALQYFSTLCHKRHDFRKKKSYWTQNVFWFSLQHLSETFLILRRNEQDMIKKILEVFMQSTYYTYQILMKLEFTWQFFFLNVLNYQVSRNSVQWEPSCPTRTDGRADMTKLIVAFRNFANAPKNILVCDIKYCWNMCFWLWINNLRKYWEMCARQNNIPYFFL